MLPSHQLARAGAEGSASSFCSGTQPVWIGGCQKAMTQMPSASTLLCRQGSVAGWRPLLEELDERARQLQQQAGDQRCSGSSMAAAKPRRRRRRKQPDLQASSDEKEL